MASDGRIHKLLQKKPIRSINGVAPITVLTKPFPCPGKCIFCPTDVRMPKSYLHDEPIGAFAEYYSFDPYNQTLGRIKNFYENGHSVDKIELIILGGTWTSYPLDYQEDFIKRCFDALNGSNSESLEQALQLNEKAKHRNVTTMIETRPDHITPKQIPRLRRLGITKVQIGAPSLNPRVLALSKRGHDVDAIRNAITLLRAGGFKIVLEWMPNLPGATLESDRSDYQMLWEDLSLRPDEIKILPCVLLKNSELYQYWQQDKYHPYTGEELIDLIAYCKSVTPPYVRINRVSRLFPSDNIVAGSKFSNLRQEVLKKMCSQGLECHCVRCREIRDRPVDRATLKMDVLTYESTVSTEYFISFNTPDGWMAGMCRVSIPKPGSPYVGVPETFGTPVIRALNVFGPALNLGSKNESKAQHAGLGTRMLEEAQRLARSAGFTRIAMNSAIGVRTYYLERGFNRSETVLLKDL
jgi:elongator complex protein 3